MREIKKYFDFISESNDSNENLTNEELQEIITNGYLKSTIGADGGKVNIDSLRSDFAEMIIDISSEGGWPSFSTLCKRRSDMEIEKELSFLVSELEREGWGWSSVANLFSKDADKSCGYDIIRFMEKTGLDSRDGIIDIYLYNVSKRLGLAEVFLGGEGWATYNEDDELVIRCGYGYHNTKYGKLLLKQLGMTVDQFLDEARRGLLSHLEEMWTDILLPPTVDWKVLNKLRNRDILEFSVVEPDRMIIYLGEISDIVAENGGSITPNQITLNIIKRLDNFKLDIGRVGDELIINYNFGSWKAK